MDSFGELYANKHYRIRRVAAKMISSNTHACSASY